MSSRALVFCTSLALASCSPMYETTTTVRFADRGAVSVLAGQGTMLPAGASSGETSARGRFATGDDSSSDYELRATREADQIVLHTSTRVALLNGEHHVLMPSSGIVTTTRSVTEPASLAAPTIRLGKCASIDRARSRGSLVGYRVRVADTCEGDARVALALEAPWSAVAEVREQSSPNRGTAVFMIAATSLLFALPGAILAGAGRREGTVRPGEQVLGFSLIGIAAMIDLGMLPTLFAEEKSEVVVPAR